jgi:hypothetical protein
MMMFGGPWDGEWIEPVPDGMLITIEEGPHRGERYLSKADDDTAYYIPPYVQEEQ